MAYIESLIEKILFWVPVFMHYTPFLSFQKFKCFEILKLGHILLEMAPWKLWFSNIFYVCEGAVPHRKYV